MLTITATIKDVIFKNAQNGYTVVNLDYNGTLLCAVGIFPTVAEGIDVELGGKFIENARYGKQFEVSEVKIIEPTKIESIERYLASGLFKGVGEATAKNIVNLFQEKTLEVIEKQPSKLAKIKGISLKRAEEISKSFVKFKAMQKAIIFFQGYGISLNLAIKIFKCYEESSITIVSQNPYRLTQDVDGIGFLSADKIAQAIGISKDSEHRLVSAIKYVLNESAVKSGNTYVTQDGLVKSLAKLLEDSTSTFLEKISNTIKMLIVTGELATFNKKDEVAIMLPKYFKTEQNISKRLIQIMQEFNALHIDVERDIADYETSVGYTLHSSQCDAVKNAVNNGVMVITGGPGTGKTTILKCIISLFAQKGLKVSLCAPTGRASKRLQDATGHQSKTIHRMLELDFVVDGREFAFDESNKLDTSVVIVDEVSMADEYIFNALLKALPKGIRLILVGDKDQLPSVGAGNVLADVIAAKIIPVSELTYIYRQSDKSLIIENAHLINKGKMPIIDNSSKDFFMSNSQDLNKMLTDIIELCKTRIPKFIGVKPSDIQILSPMKKGICGVENLNKCLQESLNPQNPKKAEIKFNDFIFRTGDKIIQTCNNYQLEWKKSDGSFELNGKGVYNGDIGVIESVDKFSSSVTVRFEDERVGTYFPAELDQLSLAYSITVHKSQGCEFDVVLMVVTSGNYMILTKNLLYTAITRAKKMVVIVGDKTNLEKMVRNHYTQKRSTCLADFLVIESKVQEI